MPIPAVALDLKRTRIRENDARRHCAASMPPPPSPQALARVVALLSAPMADAEEGEQPFVGLAFDFEAAEHELRVYGAVR